MTLEIARRWIAGRWQTSVEEEGSGSQFGVATVRLASAQILSLNSTPVQLAAAPGAGKMILPFGGAVTVRPGTQLYQAPNTSLIVYLGADESDYFITWGGVLADDAAKIETQGDQNVVNEAFLDDYENKPLFVKCLIGNPVGGNGTCVISVMYAILDIA